MTRILLIRHGATDLLGRVLYGRMAGVLLNEDGRKQACVTAQFIKRRYRLHEVVSSPLERALQTAELIASEQQLAVTRDEGITEIDFGSWMGKPFSELQDLESWRLYNRYRATEQPPGGELFLEVQARALKCLEKVLERHDAASDPTIAMVTHGDVIRSLLMLFLGMPGDNIHRLDIAPASVSVLVSYSNVPVIQSINEVFY